MSNIKIEDNFLEQKIFDELQAHMMGNTFDWYFYDEILYGVEDIERFQFVHMIYFQSYVDEFGMRMMNPIVNKIQPVTFWRIKANLLTKISNSDKDEGALHVDMTNLSDEKLKQWTTSIFYVNTNNGYTKFEDGTKVESVANRMITFPAYMKHAGTSCSDKKTRVVINFNYIEQ